MLTVRARSLLSLALFASMLSMACGSNEPASSPAPARGAESEGTAAANVAPVAETECEHPEALVADVLTEEQQAALTPDEVIELLRAGNLRFVDGEITARDHSAQVRAAALGQFPKAAILSCVDSRVPVEDVFDRGIGDIFVARVAGNFENTDIVGSLEFATRVAGAKLIMVLGHERCGAVKGAIDQVELGNLTATLANIQPAIASLSDYEGERTSGNAEFVHLVAEANVRLTVRDILQSSEIVRGMVEAGELKVVGAMYDLDTGVVTMVPTEGAPADAPGQPGTDDPTAG